jgi:hypothetical protein
MWHQDESGRVHTPFEPVVLAATLALIPILIIESDATSAGWQRFVDVANWVIWGTRNRRYRRAGWHRAIESFSTSSGSTACGS